MALAQSSNRLQQSYLAQQGMSRGGPSGLADVLDVLLDKGLVIDAFVRVSLVGIELLTIDARVVIASVDTYLRFAEAVNRLDLLQANNAQSLGDLVGGGPSGSRALSSRGQTKSSEPEDSGDTDDDEGTGDTDDSEPSQSDEGNEPEAAADEEDAGDGGEDKGLITRIKERGQVF